MADNTGEELLAAFSDYVTDQLTGENFVRWVHEEVNEALIAAEELKLGDVVTPAQIKGVATKYITEWRIEDTLIGLVGAMAAQIHATIFDGDDSIDLERSLRETVDRLKDVPEAQRLVHLLSQSIVVRRTAALMLYNTTLDTLRTNHEAAANVPGVGKLLRLSGAVTGKLATPADAMLREVTARIAGLVTGNQSTVPIDALFEPVGDGDLASAVVPITADEVADVLVVVIELFRDLRTTRSVRVAVEAGVDSFFAQYADVSLAQLLDEVGVTRDDMIEEALRFAPRVIRVMEERGLIDKIVRRRFSGFVDSDRVRALLRDAD